MMCDSPPEVVPPHGVSGEARVIAGLKKKNPRRLSKTITEGGSLFV